MTALSRNSGKAVLELATEACLDALSDAGLSADAVDAVLTYHMNDSAPIPYLARSLGISKLGWHNEIYGGGTQTASILGDAAMLIEAGLAETVLIYRALNGRSGKRMGQTALRLGAGGEEQFTLPYGMQGPVHLFALAAQRFLFDRRMGEDDLAAVVMSSRAAAAGNPRALMREPMSREQYAASPIVATPLRRPDCCLETDGAAALVVTSTRTEVGRSGRAARITAVVRGGGPGSSTMDKADDVSRLFSGYLARELWDVSGLGAKDVDLLLLYDAYSFLVLAQLEDFGFCGRGESGSLVRTGTVRINPHGGLLSEGYVHGLNNVAEAVRRLRADAAVALVTGFGGSFGSCALLTRE
jgi:acetyl-CoA acetyltransferase